MTVAVQQNVINYGECEGDAKQNKELALTVIDLIQEKHMKIHEAVDDTIHGQYVLHPNGRSQLELLYSLHDDLLRDADIRCALQRAGWNTDEICIWLPITSSIE